LLQIIFLFVFLDCFNELILKMIFKKIKKYYFKIKNTLKIHCLYILKLKIVKNGFLTRHGTHNINSDHKLES